jgi:ABC-type lipoprotein export system ATPase subunit
MAMIEFRAVRKIYQLGNTTVKALDGVTFDINQGDFIAIRGPSGSGKSTLMHLLGFLDQPTSGEIFFDESEISTISPINRAMIRSEKIGFVFQSFNLLPRLDVLRNTLLPLSYNRKASSSAKERVWKALEQVGMLDRAHHHPNQLSGGQRQRVAIARALINEPRIILADEPTGNLDSQTACTIMDLFKKLNEEGRTVVIVTHDAHVAQYSRRQIEVLDGKIVNGAHA